MFDATILLNQWNDIPGNPKRDIKDFFKLKGTKQFLEELLKEVNLPYLKTRGKYGGTLMHPYLFIKYSMWLNPRFELVVIKFVYDQLIKNRHHARDEKSLVLLRWDFFCIEIQRQFNYTTSCDHIYGAMALLGVVSEEKKTVFI